MHLKCAKLNRYVSDRFLLTLESIPISKSVACLEAEAHVVILQDYLVVTSAH